MKLLTRRIAVTLIYILCLQSAHAENNKIKIHEIGVASSRGSILGVQAYFQKRDFQSVENFLSRIRPILGTAKSQGFLQRQTIVVFPEHVGLYLATLNQAESVFTAVTESAAMQQVACRRIIPFLWELAWSDKKDSAAEALFQVRAAAMLEAYEKIFSTLAKEFQVTIVAGSIPLPEIEMQHGKLRLKPGPLYNQTLVFRPDGTPEEQIVKKHFPIARELEFMAADQTTNYQVFDTAVGKVGVLICADAWFPQAYAALEEKAADYVVVPTYTLDQSILAKPWNGYSGWEAPADCNLTDVKTITEWQAFNKYALPGRIKTSKIKQGLVVRLRGNLWKSGPTRSAEQDPTPITDPQLNADLLVLHL
ncbi:carbon-nitrogen hydrolase [bacterium]|nr:carbon-nitrogen hydrolase [bacterium]